MAFLNKISGMAKNIGDKAGDMVETTKLNSKINAENNAIAGIYRKIGEYFYQYYTSGKKLPKEAAELCAEIDGHNAAIDEAKAEIERIKAQNTTVAAPPTSAAGGAVCPSCGKGYIISCGILPHQMPLNVSRHVKPQLPHSI